jgi:hypothetical protein
MSRRTRRTTVWPIAIRSGEADTEREATMFVRRVFIPLAAVAVAAVGLVPGSALASHAGAQVTCDSGDSFTLRAVDNGAGFQSPTPFRALVFEEGGVLTVHSVSVDGAVLFSHADVGRARNAVSEVTCSFTIGAGAFFEVRGIMSGR